MPQVTVYVDQDTAQKMRRAARTTGLSLSKWVARVIQESTRSEWPESVKALAGAWEDFPTAEQLRARAKRDAPREAL
ncbi:MAG: CopG family transcriptional regulator [Deltaproteobacteria bacterium]|nr:CopG family transcriptional regulator [Deltaproteobacteria bacterium]